MKAGGEPTRSGAAGSSFDGLAADYDASFTHSSIGKIMRRVVRAKLDAAFSPGDRVLDLGCGTGEDAAYLGRRGVRVLAMDSSAAMVRQARRKLKRHGLEEVVEVAHHGVERLHHLAGERPLLAARWSPAFDGVVANFGALNCVGDLPALARELALRTRPGARALLCIMGPTVPWEWCWYLARGQPRQAFRRLSRGGVRWRGMSVHYPSIRAATRAFEPHFERRHVTALGVFVPPTYAEAWALRHPRLLALLDGAERLLEAVPPLPALADHYLIELRRR